MLLHQDASSHEWVAGQIWDLVVTLDDATSEVYSGFFVEEEGTMSTFQALHGGDRGACSARSMPIGRRTTGTRRLAGGKVDKDNPTQVGRALQLSSGSS